MAVAMTWLAILATTGTSVLAMQTRTDPTKLIANSVSSGFQVDSYLDTTSHDCTGCDFVGDLRCKFEFRDEFFHRINNCLWPMYDVVDAARKEKGLRCFILDKSLSPVLEPLVKDMDYRFIGSKSDCIESVTGLETAAAYPEGLKKMPPTYKASELEKSQLATNRDYLSRDAALTSSPIKQPYVILILRKGGSTTRVFDKASEKLLKHALEEVGKKHGVTVATYDGSESQSETIGLFAHASGVVGFHGGGFANTLFASKPLCVVEMSTFVEADYSDKTLGRVINLNEGWYPTSPNGPAGLWKDWSYYGVPVQQIVEANGGGKGLINGDAGWFIQEKTISLTDHDVSEVVGMLDKCL